MAEWLIATVAGTPGTCGGCRTPIGKGEIYALVSIARLPRCASCGERMTGAPPPADVWVRRPITDTVPSNVRQAIDSGFSTPRQFAKRTAEDVRDGKLAACGRDGE
jgi:hypothetical protein